MITMILCFILKKYFPEYFFIFKSNIKYFIFFKIFPSLLFITIILKPNEGFSQEFTYSVIKGEKKIGTLSVKQIISGKQIIYSISSQAKTGFIFTLNVNVMIDEIYEKGELRHSTFIRKINGIETIKNTIDKVTDGYVIKDDDNESRFLFRKVYYSMASMYYTEPVNMESVYSESYKQFVPVIPAGKNCYLVKFPDGNKSFYTYKNGICTTVEVNTNLAKLFFKINEMSSFNAVITENKF